MFFPDGMLDDYCYLLLLLLLLLLIEPCLVFYPVCLFSCDVQLSHQRFGSLGVLGFPFFAIFADRLSSISFT